VSPWMIAWLAMGGYFLLVEALALFRSRTGTLSDTIRIWVGARGGHWTWRRWALLAFMVWLTGHLCFGWWPS
jgi:hypothetical protein